MSRRSSVVWFAVVFALSLFALNLNARADGISGHVGQTQGVSFPGNKPPVFKENFTTESALSSNVSLSRPSNATMFDASGNLTFAPNNALKFNTTLSSNWSITSTTVTTGVQDKDGGTNAVTLTATASNSQVYQTTASVFPSQLWINSVWIRRRTGSGTVTMQAPDQTPHNLTLTSDWQQFYFKALGWSGTTPVLNIRMATPGDAIDMYLPVLAAITYETAPRPQDQVLNVGASAYFGPRFNYDPSTDQQLGLLIEAARTNLALQSNAFTTTWTTIESSVAQSGASPDGTNDGWTLTAAAGSGFTPYLNQAITNSSGQNYALSIYAWSGTISYAFISYTASAAGTYCLAVFDLTTLSSGGASQTSSSSATCGTPVKTYLGNGYYRLTIPANIGTVTTGNMRIGPAPAATGNSISSAGTVVWTTTAGTETINIFGAQIEASTGGDSTSYDPTGTTAVARSADTVNCVNVCLNAFKVSSMSAEVEYSFSNTSNVSYPISGGTNRLFTVYRGGGHLIQLVDGSNDILQSAIVAVPNVIMRMGGSYSSNGRALAVNNLNLVTDNHVYAGTSPITIGGGPSGGIDGDMREICIWNPVLANTVLLQKSAVGAPC